MNSTEIRPIQSPKKYLPWSFAGGPNKCKHGYADGIACPTCDARPLLKPFAGLGTPAYGNEKTIGQIRIENMKDDMKNAEDIPCPKCGNKGKDNSETNVICDWCYFYAPAPVWEQLKGGVFLPSKDCQVLLKLVGHHLVSKDVNKIVGRLKQEVPF